jgi:hypothetical protein
VSRSPGQKNFLLIIAGLKQIEPNGPGFDRFIGQLLLIQEGTLAWRRELNRQD